MVARHVAFETQSAPTAQALGLHPLLADSSRSLHYRICRAHSRFAGVSKPWYTLLQ